MKIVDNHSAFNNAIVRNGIKIYETTSVRSYIMEGKIKRAVRTFYTTLLEKHGEFEKYKREFRALTGKLLPSLSELELRIERMSLVKMEYAMNMLYDSGTEECLKALLGACPMPSKTVRKKKDEVHPFRRHIQHKKY